MSKKVYWKHHLSRLTSSTMTTKRGEYFGKIKHTVKHWRKPDAEQMAIVKFEGNKSYSRVPFDDLSFDEAQR